MFSFLITKGIVLMKTTAEDKELLIEEYKSFPFQAQKRTMKSWLTIPIKSPDDIEQIIPFVRKSYELVISKYYCFFQHFLISSRFHQEDIQ
jgi:predicted DNA-binding protein (MmcQ/YjbR family)